RASERHLKGVVGTHRAAGDDRVPGARAVGPDVRRHLVTDPRLVGLMPPRALLQRKAAVRPAGVVEGVDAVELDPAVVDEVGDGADHAVALVVPGPALLAGEDDDRPTVVPVAD